MKTAFLEWKNSHPDLWEFILFNILSNCATVTNFTVMWICTGILFTSLRTIPFQFFIFNYTDTNANLGLCGFLSFLLATICAQSVNFIVQKKFVFQSNSDFSNSVSKYILLTVILIIISTALPTYSQKLLSSMHVNSTMIPTIASFINILVQVIISYPAMKFWIMKKA